MKSIMTRAHKIARTLEGNYSARMSFALKQAWNESKSISYVDAAAIINKDFAGCYAIVKGASIEIVYRGKKSDKIFVSNGSVSKNGGWQVASVAGQIAKRFNLSSNF